jgi:hypothetical protein
MVWGSTAGRGNIFLSSAKHPKQLYPALSSMGSEG